MQDMTPAQNLRLQGLFEDSTTALAGAVEQLSAAVSRAKAELEAMLATVEPPHDSAAEPACRYVAAVRQAQRSAAVRPNRQHRTAEEGSLDLARGYSSL